MQPGRTKKLDERKETTFKISGCYGSIPILIQSDGVRITDPLLVSA